MMDRVGNRSLSNQWLNDKINKNTLLCDLIKSNKREQNDKYDGNELLLTGWAERHCSWDFDCHLWWQKTRLDIVLFGATDSTQR